MSEEHYPGEADEAATDEASCMEPMTPHALTREQVEYVCQHAVIDGHYSTRVSAAYTIKEHDAAQRETIRRLERERDAARFLLNMAMDELMKSQARLTASEAKRKWTTARPTVAGWYWLRAPKHGCRDAVVWIEKDGDGPESYFYMPDDDSTPVDEIDGEWQGPLTPGEE